VIPAALLECLPAPPPRPVVSDRDTAELIAALAEAGEDCRGKLAAVKQAVQKETPAR
jgi:hypothetical protein